MNVELNLSLDQSLRPQVFEPEGKNFLAGIDGRTTFPPIHESTGSEDVLEYYSQVPPEYFTRLGAFYSNDFEIFGYEFLGLVKKLLQSKQNQNKYESSREGIQTNYLNFLRDQRIRVIVLLTHF